MGWTIAPLDVSGAIRKVHDFLTVDAAAPLQAAAAAALAMPETYYAGLSTTYRTKRDRVMGILTAAGFRCIRPRGAHYIMTDMSALGFTDDVTMARYLVTEVGVASVPGSSFYRDRQGGQLQHQFCFCKKDETLTAAEQRLAAWAR